MRHNNFEKIYQAAIHQDTDLLPTGSYCIDEHAKGQYEYSRRANDLKTDPLPLTKCAL